MNSFGRLFRVNIFGESHGPSVGIIIDGCPAGIRLQEDDFTEDLERRKGGMQKATTPRKEDDKPIFLSGWFNGKTTGSPLTILFENKNTRSADYEKQQAIPRPGHADFVAEKKFAGNQDYRGGGHFSGRLTVCLVAAGVVAKKLLNYVPELPKPTGLYIETGPDEVEDPISVNAVLTEVGGEKNVEAGIDKAIREKDSVGGIVAPCSMLAAGGSHPVEIRVGLSGQTGIAVIDPVTAITSEVCADSVDRLAGGSEIRPH